MIQKEAYKKCIGCNEVKRITEFKLNGNSMDGYTFHCFKCKIIKSTNTLRREKDVFKSRTRRGVVRKIYSRQRSSSRNRNHVYPNYTFKELLDWVLSQPNFEELYSVWVDSNYDKWLKPSTNRLNNNKPYTFNNIELITWGQNDAKEHQKVKLINPVTNEELEFTSIRNTYKAFGDTSSKKFKSKLSKGDLYYCYIIKLL